MALDVIGQLHIQAAVPLGK